MAPPDSLVAGNNVFIELDGTLRPRYGYTLLQGAANTINARINGGIAFQDENGNFQYVVATDTKWYALLTSWTSITDNTNPQFGDIADPARFTVFWQSGIAYVIGVDNFSVPKRWAATLATYQTLNSPSVGIVNIVGNGSNATVNLTTPVSNIIVGDSVTIAGNSIGAFNGTFVVVAVPSPTSFTFASASVLTGTSGMVTDNTTIPAPAAKDIAVVTNRLVVVNTLESGNRFIHRVRWSAVNDATRWPTLAFIDILDAEDDPIVAIQPLGQNLATIYCQNSIFLLQAIAGDDAGAFATERLQTAEGYTGPASPAAIVSSEGLNYFLSYTGKIRTFDGIQVTPISTPIDAVIQSVFGTQTASRCHGVKLTSRRHVWFFIPAAAVTGIVDEPTVGVVYDVQRQIFLPLQSFSEPITASFAGQVQIGLTWQNCPYNWTNIPFTWENAPVGLESDTMLCAGLGEVDTFFRGFMDGSHKFPIPYKATWAYLYDPQNVLKMDFAEFFFQPVPMGTELLTCQFDSLTFPYDPGTPLVSFAALLKQGWTQMPVEPGPNNPQNIRNNLIRLGISSSMSLGGSAFGGATLYLYKDPRGTYSTG